VQVPVDWTHWSGELRRHASLAVVVPVAPVALVALAALTLSVAGCGDRAASQPPKAARDRTATALTEAQLAFIKVEPAGGGAAGYSDTVPARVAFRPQALSSLGAPFAGRIMSVQVRPGEPVRAGAPLVVLQSADASAARAQLEQALARAAAAEDQLRRQNEMMARGVGLEVERVEAQTRASEARTELERAKRTLALAGGGQGSEVILRAPVAGIVVSVRATVGAMADPAGEPLVELADPARVWVVAEVAERDAAQVAPGQRATVRIPAVDARIDGTVDGIGSAVDAVTRRLPVYIALGRPPSGLTAGMLAEVRFTASRDTLSVPVSAVLIKDGQRRIVYVQRDDGRFEARAVRTGRASGGRVAILEGLRPGERIVVQGALLLDGEAELLL
jgi:cobalt-zinc-cadmium efflux system membrane fusion protein